MSQKPSRAARERDGGKSFDGFSLPPHNIVVIGVDTKHGPEHPLYSQRAVDIANGTWPYDERMIRSLHTFGVKVAVGVRYVDVAEGDTLWPEQMRGERVHVLVFGRMRVIHGRRVVDEKFAAGAIGAKDRWQIKCVLEHAKADADLIAIVVDENVCRRVLDDAEIAEGILHGINANYTLEEMAERFNVSVNKAKRLKARAEGVPDKPPKEPRPRVPAAAIARAIANLNEEPSMHMFSNRDIAELLNCIRGDVAICDAPRVVRVLLGAEDA